MNSAFRGALAFDRFRELPNGIGMNTAMAKLDIYKSAMIFEEEEHGGFHVPGAINNKTY